MSLNNLKIGVRLGLGFGAVLALLPASVAYLDQMTQQNAALVEESAAASESLKEQASLLAQVVSTFQLQR